MIENLENQSYFELGYQLDIIIEKQLEIKIVNNLEDQMLEQLINFNDILINHLGDLLRETIDG